MVREPQKGRYAGLGTDALNVTRTWRFCATLTIYMGYFWLEALHGARLERTCNRFTHLLRSSLVRVICGVALPVPNRVYAIRAVSFSKMGAGRAPVRSIRERK